MTWEKLFNGISSLYYCTSLVASHQDLNHWSDLKLIWNNSNLFFSLAQLVSSGVKGVTQQGIRTSASPQTVSLTQGRQPFQLITPLQRPRMQQATAQPQTLTSRTLQRTPITIKMATPGTSQLTDLQLNFDNIH